MFRQVQSPRHVLSELLQNADDAGATWARVRLTGDQFSFEHNGADFDEVSLQSLCGFGQSNKRNLQTIGFRGLGFKSTFSYGPRVEVLSPTLAFAFEKTRFTIPKWLDQAPDTDHTIIRIQVEKSEILKRIGADVERWQTNPVPMLFFSNLRRLELNDERVTKEFIGEGPTPQSSWYSLRGRQAETVLHVVSTDEEFPFEALAEIRQERGAAEDLELPRARVEIIVGAQGDQLIYSVLPTDVRPPLPFSCNGPFVQDPARTGIKDPSQSTTNRWLLNRVGILAAETMLAWLGNRRLPLSQRAAAYQLLAEPEPPGASADAEAARAILGVFRRTLTNRPCLLSDSGELSTQSLCLALPPDLLGVWSPEQQLATFARDRRHVLADVVSREARSSLVSWNLLKVILPDDVLRRLAQQPLPPQPPTWDRVAALWAFLKNNQKYPYVLFNRKLNGIALVPVMGADVLYPATAVVVLPGTVSSLDAGDLTILERHARVIDPAWLQYVRATSEESPTATAINPHRNAAREVLTALGLDRESTLQRVFDDAAREIFRKADPGEEGVRLAWIAARADLRATPDFFRYCCTDGYWHSPSEQLLAALTPEVEDLLPTDWTQPRVLAEVYTSSLEQQRVAQWRCWLASDKSGVGSFAKPVGLQEQLRWTREDVEQFLSTRGGRSLAEFHWRTSHFKIQDYDFLEPLWDHWHGLAAGDPQAWSRVVQAVAVEWPRLTSESGSVVSGAIYEMRTGSPNVYRWATFPALWLQKLQGLPSLLDTFSQPHPPSELLWRSPETEPLLRIEPLLHDRLNRDEYKDFMLRLGVRDRSDRFDKVVERLRALAHATEPPLDAVLSLYRTLDQIAPRLTTDQLTALSSIFQGERLILGDDNIWHTGQDIYQLNDDDVPGAPVVHRAMGGLSLWDRLGIARHPTVDLAIAWLKRQPLDQKVEAGDVRRIRAFLRREPQRVLEGCQAWIDLASYWTPLASLRYKSADWPAQISLFQPLKRAIADVSMLEGGRSGSGELGKLSFAESLLSRKAVRVQVAGPASQPPWLKILAHGLRRARLRSPESDSETNSVHLRQSEAARRLLQTKWQPTSILEVMPYLGADPAGPALSAHACWEGTVLYVRGSSASYHRELVDVLCSGFPEERLHDAIRDCVARDAEFVESYFQENFAIEAAALDGSESPQEASQLPLPGPLGLIVVARPSDGGNATEVETLRGSDGSPAADLTSVDDGSGQNTPVLPRHSADPSEEAGERPTPLNGDSSLRHNGVGWTDGEDRSSPGRSSERTDTSSRRRQDHATEILRAVCEKLGYRWDPTQSILVAEDGSTIRPSAGLFPWARYNGQGRIQQNIWIALDALQDGIDIPGDIWIALGSNPEEGWLLTPTADNQAALYDWSKILVAIQNHQIDLFQGDVRLRADQNAGIVGGLTALSPPPDPPNGQRRLDIATIGDDAGIVTSVVLQQPMSDSPAAPDLTDAGAKATTSDETQPRDFRKLFSWLTRRARELSQDK
jgi:hypothetical protein